MFYITLLKSAHRRYRRAESTPVNFSTITPQLVFSSFYPRHAMLARVLAMALCLFVRPSVTSRCSSETAG